jgi:hypothetical protein
MRAKVIAGAAALLAVALVLVLLAGCESADSAAARRAAAEADRVRAEGEAYQARAAADTQAAAERAAIREAARQAGHERALETLPFVVLLVGALGLAGLGAVLLWDTRTRPRADAGPAIVAYLADLRAEQARHEADLWRAIAHLDRRRELGPGAEVTIYDDRRTDHGD